MKRVFVLASTESHFNHWCRKLFEAEMIPNNKRESLPTRVIDKNTLRGRKPESILVLLEGWDQFRKYADLNELDIEIGVWEKLLKRKVIRCTDEETEPLKKALK